MAGLKFNIRYTGGDADNHKMDLYDAATSIHGLAKALAISTHALVENGEVRHRGGSIPNVKFYLHPPQKGSFVELVSVFFEDPAVRAIGSSLVVAGFWDMINYTWRSASGSSPTPNERRVSKIVENNETFPLQMADALEKPLEQIHRPILHNSNVKIEIRRPRVGTVLEFDQSTLDYVTTTDDSEVSTNILGNVTKYNILTGYGRFYDDNEGRTIPFNLSEGSSPFQDELTWSIRNASQEFNGKIILEARIIRDRVGNVKRYIIQNARRIISN